MAYRVPTESRLAVPRTVETQQVRFSAEFCPFAGCKLAELKAEGSNREKLELCFRTGLSRNGTPRGTRGWKSRQLDSEEQPGIIAESGVSALRHLRPSGFEDFAFALGQALDTVGGDFVEYRVHFAANEFRRRKIVHELGAFLSPE